MNRAVILLVLLSLGCSRNNSATVVATGTLEAVEVDVAPLVPGRVVRVLVNEGDSVKAGQTVAELTQPTSQAAVEQSRAQVQASRAALSEAQTGPRAAEIRRAQGNQISQTVGHQEQGKEQYAADQAAKDLSWLIANTLPAFETIA